MLVLAFLHDGQLLHLACPYRVTYTNRELCTSDVNASNMHTCNVNQDLSTTVIGNVITCAMSNKAMQLVMDGPYANKIITFVILSNDNFLKPPQQLCFQHEPDQGLS